MLGIFISACSEADPVGEIQPKKTHWVGYRGPRNQTCAMGSSAQIQRAECEPVSLFRIESEQNGPNEWIETQRNRRTLKFDLV
jgi:hypothetical protein